MFWHWLLAALKKKSKNPKKTYIVLCTLKCTKNIFLFEKKEYCILNIFRLFKINKSHCSSEFLIFLFF